MSNISFRIPEQIDIGFNKSKNLVDYSKKMGMSKILIVTDNVLLELGLLDDILESFDNEEFIIEVYDEIKQEPTADEINYAIDKLNVSKNFDGVIGIGGGSTIDVAKILSVSSKIKGSIVNYIGTDKIKGKGLPMIVVPTTSGTGAEATPNAIIKDEEEQCKKGVVSPYLIPDLVVIDPALTLSLPAKITAETGMDAFTHAIECYICNKSNIVSDMFALKGINLISKYIRAAVEDGSNKEARYYMALGSLMGGIAITNSGTGGVHALAYPLGGKYGISHGLSNSILLPDVMEFNAEAVPEKFVKVAKYMDLNISNLKKEEIVQKVVEEIRQLTKDVGINISDFEITEVVIHDLAKRAMKVERLLNNNPRIIKFNDVVEIYHKALNK